jgi:tetratricopeptide (TPR) repeat protein
MNVEILLVSTIARLSWRKSLKGQSAQSHTNKGFFNLPLLPDCKDCSTIATAQKAAELEPSNPHPLVALAIAYWGKGDHPLAVQAYRKAIGVDGRYGDRAFLAYLKEAGFHADQIHLSQQVLAQSL